MKKVFSILLVALLIAGVAFASPGNQVSPGAGDIVAKHGAMSTPDRTFRLVRFMPPARALAYSPSLTKDSIVIWDTVSQDGVTVTTTTTSGDCRVAGIAVVTFLTPEVLGKTASDDMNGRSWGWIQTYGLCNMRIGATGTAANSVIGTGVTEGGIVTMDTTALTADLYDWIDAGFIMQQNDTALSSAVGFIRCE